MTPLSLGVGISPIHSQPNGVPFRYTPGDSLVGLGGAFARGAAATYIDQNGVLQTAVAGVARDAHYINGVRSLLLEVSRTNSFLNSDTPATHTSPSLGTGTYFLWMVGTGSIAVAAGTATITGAGTATAAAPVTFTVTVAGTVTFTVTGAPTRAQCENGGCATSYIATAAAAVTRSADLLSFPFAYAPQALTAYFKFVPDGLGGTAGNPAGVFSIGNAANTGNILETYNGAGSATFTEGSNFGGFLSTSNATALAAGDTVELRVSLAVDGTLTLGVSKNGAAEVTSSAAGGALPGAFSAPTSFWLGCLGNATANAGLFAFQSVKVALGVQSLATMRAA